MHFDSVVIYTAFRCCLYTWWKLIGSMLFFSKKNGQQHDRGQPVDKPWKDLLGSWKVLLRSWNDLLGSWTAPPPKAPPKSVPNTKNKYWRGVLFPQFVVKHVWEVCCSIASFQTSHFIITFFAETLAITLFASDILHLITSKGPFPE